MGGLKLPRPARKLSPEEFYRSYVPELVRATAGPTTLPGEDFAIRSEIDGAAWTFSLRNGELAVSDGPSEAIVTFSADLESFRIAMFDLLPRVLKTVALRASTQEHLSGVLRAWLGRFSPKSLRGRDGTVTVNYVDDAGDEAKVAIRVGSGTGPVASVVASDADLWAFLEGGGGISTLLKTRVEVHGDVAYLLSLAQTLEV